MRGPITLSEISGRYMRQLEAYKYLFHKNGFKVAKEAYIVYRNGNNGASRFDNRLNFSLSLLNHEGESDWIEEAIIQAYSILKSTEAPTSDEQCNFCKYVASALPYRT